MSEKVFLQEIDALLELERGLRRFREVGERAILVTEQEVKRALSSLDDRIANCRRQVERCKGAVESARYELERCSRSANDDCRAEERELDIAIAGLESAEGDLAIARRWLRRVDEAAELYRREARELHFLVGTRTSQASQFLQSHHADLQRYARLPAPPGVAIQAPGISSSPGLTAGAGVQVVGFDASNLMTTDEVRSYLTSRIPEGHATAIKSVRYSGRFVREDEHRFCAGVTETPREGGASEITIHAQYEDGRCYDRPDLEDTLAHETAHCVWHAFLDDADRDAWLGLSAAGGHRAYVSSYGRTDHKEDFAESYASYVNYPELLKSAAPDKYTFLKDRVFSGREYS